ncbi:MAG: lipopolysaccharide kinase InaA family protein [Candidatus Binatia bacterium]
MGAAAYEEPPASRTAPMIPCVLPAGFTEQHSGKVTWWIKAGWETALPQAVTSAGTAADMHGGRGAVHRVVLREGGIGIARRYYRGGFIRHFVRDLYWDRPPRPFVELICTEIVRQRGVPAVEVLGARVEWGPIGLYRGMFVTREAPGFLNLWEWLCTQPTGRARESVLAAVARVIAQLHATGIEHADLNLTNILVRSEGDAPAALLIDFDRARLFPGPLSYPQRERNLRRLRRSLAKLDPGGRLFSAADLDIFYRAYYQPLLAI